MKKYLIFLFLSGISLAQTTSNFHFNIPATGTAANTWGPLLNANFSCLDYLLVGSGVSNCPTGAPLPSLISGTNISITGTWPNQTINATSGGGTPSGSPGQIQWNSAGSFAGFTASGDCTINTSTGVVTCTKTNGSNFAPIATSGSASDLSAGTVPAARMPAMTGDATSSTGSVGLTLATVNSSPGTFAPSTIVVDAKGRVTAVTALTGVDNVVSSGLLAQYRILPSENPCALVDYSGNGNTGTGCVGTSPTIIATTGGINLPGTGASVLPSTLSSTGLTFQVFATAQATSSPNAGAYTGFFCMTPTTSNGLSFNLSSFVGGTNATGLGSFSGGTWHTTSDALADGTGMFSLVLSNPDVIYVNSTAAGPDTTGNSIGASATGSFQLGGCLEPPYSYMGGKIYYMLVYNRALTAGEVAANAAAVQQALLLRGVSAGMGATPTTNNNLVAAGDSITYGYGAVSYSSLITLNGSTWTKTNRGLSGIEMAALAVNGALDADVLYQPLSGQNVVAIWAGTNDISNTKTAAATLSALQSYCNGRQVRGFRCLLATMIARGGLDAQKNQFNAVVRSGWKTISDGLIDVAADPNLGADGAATNTTYFQSGQIHPTFGSEYNIVTPIFQRAINRLYACQDFSCATTYTTGQAAATAITAATESTNTMTFTSALNPGVGKTVTVAGVTPSGYNGDWLVLTSSGTTFTAYNYATGVGAGSVFGTAKIPLQKDEDVYTILGGSATSPDFTLETCVGYTGQKIYLKNTNTTSPWDIVPSGSETIDGAATLTMATATSGDNPVVILQSVLVSAAAAGCNWERIQ